LRLRCGRFACDATHGQVWCYATVSAGYSGFSARNRNPHAGQPPFVALELQGSSPRSVALPMVSGPLIRRVSCGGNSREDQGPLGSRERAIILRVSASGPRQFSNARRDHGGDRGGPSCSDPILGASGEAAKSSVYGIDRKCLCPRSRNGRTVVAFRHYKLHSEASMLRKLEDYMRLRSHLIEIAAAATLVAFAGSNALAQGSAPAGKAGSTTTQSTPSTAPSTTGKTSQPNGAANQPTTKGAGAAAPSSGPWTANNVTAARPFGDINVSAAGNTTDSMRTWAQGRSASERAELSGRCQVISNSANASRYPADAQQFCRNYMMVASAAPAGKAGTTAPAGKAGTTTR
jgi:hypothetical protein